MSRNTLRALTIFLSVLAIGFLIATPIKMGRGANKDIPVIGALETMSLDYCQTTLAKATKAYVVSKLIDRIVSVVQRTELSFSPFGMGITLAPGELLAAANDAIERLCAAFFLVMGLTLVGQLFAGMTAFLCFKVFLPACCILAVLYALSPTHLAWCRPLCALVAKLTLMVFLFFPVLATVTNYLNAHYLDSVYTENMDAADRGTSLLERDGEEMATLPKEPTPQTSDSWWERKMDSIKETIGNLSIDSIKEAAQRKATQMVDQLDVLTDHLFIVFAMFMLTTCIVPVGIFLLLLAIIRIFSEQYKNSIYFRTFDSILHGNRPEQPQVVA